MTISQACRGQVIRSSIVPERLSSLQSLMVTAGIKIDSTHGNQTKKCLRSGFDWVKNGKKTKKRNARIKTNMMIKM